MIKFIRDTLAKEGEEHKAGDVIEASPASEQRWMRRGAAIECEPEPEQKPAPKPKPRAKKQTAKSKKEK